ncbi:hypothetical protein Q4566_08395 [Tamlana sp. 2_MG-2023]|uniref:hypothetical protein n=1 Tax=unclassified Tamlana TaxID=2614803 RepID=UPI0026E431E7|nr:MULTISPECIES: hypothetical protein [unclassified Tamlana]MDO6760212.1 hypothetical protein [Tamlana sp. 2_MG-2023]MDO6790090.1 hypothetical protein [Tamlana sp. 1_MG-2023]
MSILNILLINTAAVMLMTTFTYFISYIKKTNFGEPELLTQLINRGPFTGQTKYGIWIGWVLHFIMGFVFLYGYFYLRSLVALESEILWGAVYGLFAGILGVIGWTTMFTLHPNPPKVPRLPFYLQLIGAHIVFSITISVYLSITIAGI